MMRTKYAWLWFVSAFALLLPNVPNSWAQDSSSISTTQSNAPQVAQPPDGGVNWKGVGIGAGTVLGNIFYVPAKLAYGILGGIGGGAGYALTGGNKQVANSIWRSSLGGDYVLTPDMMTGKKPIYFSGPSDPGMSQPPSIGNTTSAAPSVASPPAPSASTSTLNPDRPATHPIDSGAGLVGSNGASAAGAPGNADTDYRGYRHPQSSSKSVSPDTSIE